MTVDGSAKNVVDSVFDRYARLVRDSLDTSIALVSLITPTSQLMVGAVGLNEPSQTQREVPLNRSVCQHVAAQDGPLVIDDADSHVDGSTPAIEKLRDAKLRAYAGYPLRDAVGKAVGAVCAVDWRPRHWSDEDLSVLRDITAACSAEFALQDVRAQLARANENAAVSQSRLTVVTDAAQALASASAVDDAVRVLHEHVSAHFGPQDVTVWLVDRPARGQVTRIAASDDGVRIDDSTDGLVAPELVRDAMTSVDELRVDSSTRTTSVYLPLRAGGRDLGVLTMSWNTTNYFDGPEQDLLRALSASVAQALHRATPTT